MVTFILEDFVEVGLQFFYFEKYTYMPNDILSYFKASFMICKALEPTVRVIMYVIKEWNDEIHQMNGMSRKVSDKNFDKVF